MADASSYLFGNTDPTSLSSATSTSANLPDWYQDYLRGIAGKATDIANQGYQQYPGQRIADFNDNQNQAFGEVSANQGSWQPAMGGALAAASSIQPTAQAGTAQASQYAGQGVNAAGAAGAQANGIAGSAGAQANGAVAGPTGTFTGSNVSAYMSPYTQSVTDEIARQGDQNLTQNIIPATQNSFLGAGSFGSTRNADILGKNVRDAQTNISGLQSTALQNGYTTAGQLFDTDQAREQAQQQMQATTALNAGQLGTTTALNAGQLGVTADNNAATASNNGAQIGAAAADSQAARLGALGQTTSQLGYSDAAALGAVGAQQQSQEQQGLDQSYQDFQNQTNYNWNTLNNVSAAVRGMAIPTSTSTATSTAQPQTSPLAWVNSLYGSTQAAAPTTTTSNP